MRTDTIAICTDSHAMMDGSGKCIIPGKTPEWPNRTAARQYIRREYDTHVSHLAEHYGVTEHRIRTIIGGPKPWQDDAADLF